MTDYDALERALDLVVKAEQKVYGEPPFDFLYNVWVHLYNQWGDSKLTRNEREEIVDWSSHSHKCENCGYKLDHVTTESCEEFIAGITRSCRALE